MNYGDRQERAEYLVNRFRTSPTAKPWTDNVTGKTYSPAELADEIENMTHVGRSIVAVAGIVFTAIANDPEFFKKRWAG